MNLVDLNYYQAKANLFKGLYFQMSILYLIRHGESESNAGFQTYNPAEVKLTPKGRSQANCISGFFNQAPSLIITSPFLRAIETAAPTLKRFPRTKKTVWSVQEFTYLSYLRMPCMTVQQRRPFVDKYWDLCDPHYLDGKECESFVDFIARTQSAINKIRILSDKSIAMFTHGQFIKMFLWLQIARPPKIEPDQMKQFFNFLNSFNLGNSTIVKVRLNKNGSVWISNVITDHLTE